MTPGSLRGENQMDKAAQKFTLLLLRDVPLDKLMLSQFSVLRIKARMSADELAKDIARSDLLQNLSVRAVMAKDGSDSGKFENPAGGRRF